MALDELKDDEILFQDNGVTVLGDNQIKEQIEQSGGLTIEFAPDYMGRQGFNLKFGKEACGDDCSC